MQNMFVPMAALRMVSSWRDLVRGRALHPGSPQVRVLQQQDLQPGDWVDWTALVALIGSSASLNKALLHRLVRYNDANILHRASYRYFFLRSSLTLSCVVEAFGSRGRLVFADFDEGGLDLPQRPRGGLENCEAAIVICDVAEGRAGAVRAERLLSRADAILTANPSVYRHSCCIQEGPVPRLLALTSGDAVGNIVNRDGPDTMGMVQTLGLMPNIRDVGCEVVSASVADDNGVDHLLQLLTWVLVGQSSDRRQRLEANGGHKLLDTHAFLQGPELDLSSRRRRSRSQDL